MDFFPWKKHTLILRGEKKKTRTFRKKYLYDIILSEKIRSKGSFLQVFATQRVGSNLKNHPGFF